MIVMVSNQTAWKTHYLQGRYGGLGLLLPPNGLRIYPHLPYALDNGAFPAWTNGVEWDEECFLKALDWCERQPLKPRWVVIPDVVGNDVATYERYHIWGPRLKERGFNLAFACQDGMTPASLKENHIEASILFIGGSREWKMRTIAMWANHYPRIHVGRINGLRGLMVCHQAKVESVDGTGFFRGRRGQLDELIEYLKEFGEPEPHPMFLPQIDPNQPELF
jgi:hypothetical protein